MSILYDYGPRADIVFDLLDDILAELGDEGGGGGGDVEVPVDTDTDDTFVLVSNEGGFRVGRDRATGQILWQQPLVGGGSTSSSASSTSSSGASTRPTDPTPFLRTYITTLYNPDSKLVERVVINSDTGEVIRWLGPVETPEEAKRERKSIVVSPELARAVGRQAPAVDRAAAQGQAAVPLEGETQGVQTGAGVVPFVTAEDIDSAARETGIQLGEPLAEAVPLFTGLGERLTVTAGGVPEFGGLTPVPGTTSGPGFVTSPQFTGIDFSGGEPRSVGFGFDPREILLAAGVQPTGTAADVGAAMRVMAARQNIGDELSTILGRAATPAEIQSALESAARTTTAGRLAGALADPFQEGILQFAQGGNIVAGETEPDLTTPNFVTINDGLTQQPLAVAGEAGPELISFVPLEDEGDRRRRNTRTIDRFNFDTMEMESFAAPERPLRRRNEPPPPTPEELRRQRLLAPAMQNMVRMVDGIRTFSTRGLVPNERAFQAAVREGRVSPFLPIQYWPREFWMQSPRAFLREAFGEDIGFVGGAPDGDGGGPDVNFVNTPPARLSRDAYREQGISSAQRFAGGGLALVGASLDPAARAAMRLLTGRS